MDQKLKACTVAGIIFVSITGTLAHFVYGWSGNWPPAGFFTPVSESVWEHMKLVFFPMLLYCVLETMLCFRNSWICISCANSVGILTGTLVMPVIYYVYSGILGRNYLSLDILTFFICVLLAFYCRYRYSKSCICEDYTPVLLAMILFMAAAFLVFTVNPPSLGIFQSS